MNKPGSHRGAASIKKGKFANGIKKIPKSTLEKLREYIVEAIKNAEENSKQGRHIYHSNTSFRCSELAKKFKCRIGEIAKSVETLNREGLTSTITKRYMSFSITYKDYRDEEDETSIETYYNFDNCPVCNTKLERMEDKSKVWDWNEDTKQRYIKEEILRGLVLKCKNDCFLYDANKNFHMIKIFDEHIAVTSTAHKSIINHKLKMAKKEIKRAKKNERYLIKIMMKDF